MPVRSLVIEFIGVRTTGPDVGDGEFANALAIQPGEVEAAGASGPGSVRVSSVRFSPPPGNDAPVVAGVPDDAFDAWAADAFRAAVQFLERRPETVFADLKASGFDLRMEIEVSVTGEFPIIDWPPELYDACRRHGVGLLSIWPDAT
jgi:hypothetical protein